ncbi:MAG: c-type cytochrome [Bacteroidia bacterium]|nr:c-type cytochrome [Bacteroidia bacterium]
MKQLLLLPAAVLTLAISYNCSKPNIKSDPANVSLDLPSSPFEYNKVSTSIGKLNNYYEDLTLLDNDKATLGRVLFYDKALSINNSVACASCHSQDHGFADITAFSKGFAEKPTERNSMGISNLVDERNIGYFWDARETKIESMVFAPIANHIEMGFDRIDLISTKVSNLPYYNDLIQKAYGTTEVSEERLRESLAQFLFSIVSQNTKFDIGMYKGFSNFTASEKNGMQLFNENLCGSCHQLAAGFSSSYGSIKFANIGLDKNDNDPGINGLYKIPRLKNIALTGPYMHDGRFKNLEEVLNHYSENIQDNAKLHGFLKESTGAVKKMEFSEQDKRDIIAFLNTLTDMTTMTDKKFSNPFN